MANNSLVSMMEVTNRTTDLVYSHQDSTHYNSSLPWYSQPNADVQRIVAVVWFALCALIGVPPTILVITIYVRRMRRQRTKSGGLSNAMVIDLLALDVAILLVRSLSEVGNLYQFYQTEWQCRLYNIAIFSFTVVIQLILFVGIPLERYIAIAGPMHREWTIKKNLLTLFTMHMVVAVLSVGPYFISALEPIPGNPGIYACTIDNVHNIWKIMVAIIISFFIITFTGLNVALLRNIWQTKVSAMRDHSTKAVIVLFWRDCRMLVINYILVSLTLVTWIPVYLTFFEIIPDSPMYRFTSLIGNTTHCYVFGACNPRIRKKVANLLGCGRKNGHSSTSTS